MQFLLLISHDDTFAPTEQLVEDIRAWHAEMDRRGIRRDGRPLRPPAEAFTVRVRAGERLVTSGARGPGLDQTAAYELVDCAGPEEALEIAGTHPMAKAGTIEVRAVWEELSEADRGETQGGKVV